MSDQAAKLDQLSVAVCQLTSVDDVGLNLSSIVACLRELEESPPGLVSFPENSLYLRVREGTPITQIDVDGAEFETLSKWAVAHGSVVHLGSVPLKKGGRLFNSTVLLTPDGAVHDIYQKIHLFDVDVEGHKAVRESDVFAHGEEPALFTVKGWKFGATICYDLRFSELFLHYAKRDVDVVLIPSAFLVPTGRDHWEILTRARAIESQVYVLAAAQGGEHVGVQGGHRATWGQSCIIDPWGKVMAQAPVGVSGAKVLRAELSRERIERVRAQIPMKNHRRLS